MAATEPAREVMHRFFAAFDAGDGAAMAACYSPVAHYSDPVFPSLAGDEVGAMWRMLTSRAAELSVSVEQLGGDDRHATATWIARYLFGPDRRPVVNRVRSRFDLGRGVILTQQDVFDLHAWSAQALGVRGRLLGWTPMVRSAVRRQAAEQLSEFRAAEAAAPPAS
jgi:hypothetical protein